MKQMAFRPNPDASPKKSRMMNDSDKSRNFFLSHNYQPFTVKSVQNSRYATKSKKILDTVLVSEELSYELLLRCYYYDLGKKGRYFFSVLPAIDGKMNS
jgi:hypothetical protein